MVAVPTVLVNRNGNKVRINAGEFDPGKDKKWEDPVAEAPVDPAPVVEEVTALPDDIEPEVVAEPAPKPKKTRKKRD